MLDNTPPALSIGNQVDGEQDDVHWVHGVDPHVAKLGSSTLWLDVESFVLWLGNGPGGGDRQEAKPQFCYCVSHGGPKKIRGVPAPSPPGGVVQDEDEPWQLLGTSGGEGIAVWIKSHTPLTCTVEKRLSKNNEFGCVRRRCQWIIR